MPILDLPEEMYDAIFAHLSLVDVFNCMQVCKKWYLILEKGNSKLWKYHSLKTVPRQPLGSELLSSLSSYKSRLRAFKYAWNPIDCCVHNFIWNGFTLLRSANRLILHNTLSHRSLRDCGRGKLGFEAGRHSWELTWKMSLGNVAIVGVATKDDSNTDPETILGRRCESWGWELNCNWLMQNGVAQKHPSGVPVHYPQSLKVGPNNQIMSTYQIGDRIRVILDMEENTLEFEINNEVLGVAFRGLPKKRLFPAVMGGQKQGSWRTAEVSMVYLGGHFKGLSSTNDSSSGGSSSSNSSSSGSDSNSPMQQSTSKGLALQNKRAPTDLPTASIRPMAIETQTVGRATPSVTSTANKPKRKREADCTPGESLKKRTREEELSQEPVTQTPESMQRKVFQRSLLLRKLGVTSGSESELQPFLFRNLEEGNEDVSFDEDEVSEDTEENDEEGSEENEDVSFDEDEVTDVSEDTEEKDKEGLFQRIKEDKEGLFQRIKAFQRSLLLRKLGVRSGSESESEPNLEEGNEDVSFDEDEVSEDTEEKAFQRSLLLRKLGVRSGSESGRKMSLGDH
ncbi:uncharacterized protein LOC136032555 [Artemia franciscana]|uniref:uncharacterized protein LOC136032555 n=1 Tax=Artemia franciscana TaxID=6661 RepID=UPI0032DAB8D3